MVKPSLFRGQVNGGTSTRRVDVPDPILDHFRVGMLMPGKYYLNLVPQEEAVEFFFPLFRETLVFYSLKKELWKHRTMHEYENIVSTPGLVQVLSKPGKLSAFNTPYFTLFFCAENDKVRILVVEGVVSWPMEIPNKI
jgi:hypothetical protein